MTAVVLDASAVLALLRAEPGGEIVAPLLSESLLLSINLSEVIAPFARNGIGEADLAVILAALPCQIVPFDLELAIDCAFLIPATKPAGLSLADRACLALARRQGLAAYTADRAWAAVADAVGVEIILIR